MTDFPVVWDSTMLSAFTRCQHYFHQTYVEDWRLEGESIHLHAGKAFASALEAARRAFVRGAPDWEDQGRAALTQSYGDRDSGDSPKSLSRMLGAFDFYFQTWPLTTDQCEIAILGNGTPGIEWNFAIPLPILHPTSGQPLLFAGRTDAIVRFANALYALDDKTTSQLGATWPRQWELRGQFTGYAWAMRELGLAPAGTIVRGVSILKTTYGSAQTLVFQPDWKLDQWWQATQRKLELAKTLWATQGWIKSLDEACNDYGGCSHKQCCSVADPSPWLSTYFTKVRWNPLDKH